MISIYSIRLNPSIHSPTAPQPSPPRLCPRLHAVVADLVVSQVDFFYGLVDPKRVGEGLQRWHEAKAKWKADPWALRCSCAELPTLSTLSSACRDCHSCLLMSNPHVTIQPTLSYTFHHICTVICFHLFSAVYRKVTHCNTFSMKIHSEPHTPSGKRMKFPKGR